MTDNKSPISKSQELAGAIESLEAYCTIAEANSVGPHPERAREIRVLLSTISRLQSELEAAREDTRRLDFLEHHTVNVRVPLVHGSRDLFWAHPDDSYEGETGPSDIRARISAFLSPPAQGEG